jgi:hypothetical protein
VSTRTQAQEPEQDLQEICEYVVRDLIGPGQSDSEPRLGNSWNIFWAEVDWDATQRLVFVGSVGIIFSSAH